MELRQLKYFVRIVELGSFSRAATDLFVAQPALSQRIGDLGSDLGVALLTRSVRGVTTTEAGEIFYRNARALLRQIEIVRSEVKSAADTPVGVVSIGLPVSASSILTPSLIALVAERYPNIRLQITEGFSGHLAELVTNGRVEMSLLFESTSSNVLATTGRLPSHLNVRPVLSEELYLIRKGEPGDDQVELPLQTVAEFKLILPAKPNVTRQIIDAAFAEIGREPQMLAEIDSLTTIRAVVASGIGATIGPAAIPGGTAGLRVQRITSPSLERRLSLCTFAVMPAGLAACRIADLIIELATNRAATGQWPGALGFEQSPLD